MLGKILSRRTATTPAASLVGLLPTVAPLVIRSLRRHPVPTALGLAGAAIILGSFRKRRSQHAPDAVNQDHVRVGSL